jgi:GNAT superfamily N-acetyltransferase
MSGFFGTEQQRQLQERTHGLWSWMAETPGIYNAGRFMGTDDPDKVSWDVLETILQRDRILGFRMISPEQAERYFPRLSARGYRIDTWDILVGDPDEVKRTVTAILEKGTPEGIRLHPPLSDPEGPDTHQVQEFLAANGLAPMSGSMLVGQPGEAATLVFTNRDGAVVATGHAYFPHNALSRHHRDAWVGLIAVAESMRGSGLGRYVNARMLLTAIEDLRARRVYEMVGTANLASRRMVEACGLKLAPDLLCGVAMPVETGRFTR